MSPSSAADHEALSPSIVRRLEELCNDFEDIWCEGRRPRIETFLHGLDDPARLVLLRELIYLDVTYRRAAGEQALPDDYRTRFAGSEDCIDNAFRLVDRDLHIVFPATPKPLPAGETPPPGPEVSLPSTRPHSPRRSDRLPVVTGYEILARLPVGGMGVVYKARQTRSDLIVALKMIRDADNASPQELARFRNEALAVASLKKHPHIVQLFDFGEHEGLPYFAMEFVAGGNLAQYLQGRSVPPREVAQLGETLARTIQYVHDQNIYHRDLKPANILLQSAECRVQSDRPTASSSEHSALCTLHSALPKITDFGLAKQLDRDWNLTRTRAVMGTACYMAPEQAEGKSKTIGPAADIYSLGATLYECLCGRPPFRGETVLETLDQVRTHEAAPPSRYQPDVPAELDAICLKCLAKKPEDRYATAAALADELQRFLAGKPIETGPIHEWEATAHWARQAGYELLELEGVGLLGLVYKARSLALKRLVILKTINAQARLEPEIFARFWAQAEAAACLKHANIVPVYEAREVAGQPYFCLEYLDGGRLGDRDLARPRPPREAVQLIETLARAVHYAHQQGVIHGDLRPFHVLLDATGEPKITGFGFGTLLQRDQGETSRWLRRRVTNYMAPERADDRVEAIGPATDVHALGAMLYELLAGRPPFLAPTVQETLEQVRHFEPPSPSHWQRDVPSFLDNVCARCLRKRPEERYGSAEELADALRSFLQGSLPQTDEFELVPGYEVLGELGRGGLGIVYKARQKSLDRLVALKVFRNDLSPESLRRIKDATRAAARLQHPNIVGALDSGERDGLLYVAEAFVEGNTLEEKVGGATLAPREAAQLVAALARALHYAHENGLIHCNLKPRVVLLTGQGVPRVSSFELARIKGQDTTPEEGSYGGTPRYLAPEQAEGRGDAIGPATDVYALGNILYYLLTGAPPFPGPTIAEILDGIRSRPPRSLRQLQPQVPAGLEAICLRCLEKAAAQRYPSAAALAEDLELFLAGRHPADATGVRRLLRWVTAWGRLG